MTSVQQGTLRVPGASLFYRSCGRGAPLLILAGGDADADMTDPLRDALADRYRVITLDRRGLSRSVIDPGELQPSIATHADDAQRLLAELTGEAAFVFGAGLGGIVGLDLVARYPEQVRLLVAHEAPSAELLPDAQREAVADAQQALQAAFRREGIAAAMKLRAELAGIDPEDREPDISPPAPTRQQELNTAFLLSSDVPQMVGYRLDAPALDVQARKITPAAGQSTRQTLLHRCAVALAEFLERPLVEFPGGHTGWALRPKAFAARLSETFAAVDRLDRRPADGLSLRTSGSA
jgi:pimeloyl-ACP methyl ester carboxylesterase